ncbi:hypothetical protein ACJRO7_004412 [Eucalyptus globulus]|uniref:non-specific serine/threonine protein kinase n=1 Tax=Eucalyptus globulus TaxID=34317 RepID=A0ABD3IYU5_EUCGL
MLRPSIPHLLAAAGAAFLSTFPTSLAAVDERYVDCGRQFSCGNIRNASFPFWGSPQPFYCGLPEFKLLCEDGVATMEIASQKYQVLEIDHNNHILRLSRLDFYDSLCPPRIVNATMNYLFKPTSDFGNLTLFYNCSSVNTSVASGKFSCYGNDAYNESNYYTIGSVPSGGEFGSCHASVTIPVLPTASEILMENKTSSLGEVIREGFEVQWVVDHTACTECQSSGGRCGYNTSFFQPICFCPDRPDLLRCLSKSGSKLSMEAGILIGAIMLGLGSMVGMIFLVLCLMRKPTSKTVIFFWKKKSSGTYRMEAFLEKCGGFAPKQYSYKDVKKMTNSLRDKLGQGGYGSVYKGKLPDGSLVAVKILSESKGDGKEFLNEVASISRTSHVNIVTLLGFCSEGSKRALVYEFMPNGSLEKYIFAQDQATDVDHLGWEKIYQIAIGVAHGLEYLHRGCNSRILHLDIKPQNILLDEDFCPKISDFGLSKLSNRKESTMSMMGARGTVGYIAPEVFSRNFGVVSDKSDVYSFGMMILEMAGGRRNTEAGLTNSSEVYFPHWVHSRMTLEEDLNLQWNMNETGKEVAKKMIQVGLWCTQTYPGNRPSMDGVVDMLERRHEDLEVPPKPFPSSPASHINPATSTTLHSSQDSTKPLSYYSQD